MGKYIRYELEVRQYSANCIAGVFLYTDEKGKQKEKKELIMGGFLVKKESDIYINNILNHLNNELAH